MSTNYKHQSLADGRWNSFSLAEQLGNIGSEINRTIRSHSNKIRSNLAAERALELFDLTLNDKRWLKLKRLKEIARARELFCDAVWGNSEFNTSLEDLNRYFIYFALAARAKK